MLFYVIITIILTLLPSAIHADTIIVPTVDLQTVIVQKLSPLKIPRTLDPLPGLTFHYVNEKTIPTPTNTPTNTPTPTPTPSPTPTSTPTPTPMPTPVPISASEMDTWFEQYSSTFNIDLNQLRKIAVCESGYNTNATNGPYAGLFQFSDPTWQSTRRAMGHDPNPDLRFNAEEAIKTAAWKIANGGIGAWPNCR
ncbi:transglycosylase family protein [Patescibacteria group bacterium]